MALENVAWHDHLWPSAFPWDDDRRDDPAARWRFDAVEFEDGAFAVYSAEHDEVVESCKSRRDAITRAQNLADKSLIDSEADNSETDT